MTRGPHLEGGRLLVDDKPVLLLGGELHNSSATGRLLDRRWGGIVDAGCTTVLAPVTWEQLEPREGSFDTTAVDELLDGARAHGLRLVLLWFGSWKNGVSSYVPPWVKADPDRFAVQHLGGAPTSVLSPFADTSAQADALAFGHLMAHLRTHDRDHTVLMVQVQNEVGSLGDSRDRSAEAEAAWARAVPAELIDHLRDDPDGCATEMRVSLDPAVAPGATWAEAFGEGDRTDELFMAWHLATYIERVARAGRAEHDLPLYINAWLDAGGEGGSGALAGGSQPGSYPSGGPLPHVAAAWHVGAPTIDFLAPDIYVADPVTWLGRYRDVTPAVFVPELHRSAAGLATIFLAVGESGAIGTSPFGIDELEDDQRSRLRHAYGQLAAITEDILDAQAGGTIRGFAVEPGEPIELELGGYRLAVSTGLPSGREARGETGYGLVIAGDPGEFLAAGSGFAVRATTTDGRPTVIHTVHELDLGPSTGRASDLPILRWLNGDETLSGYAVSVTHDVVVPWPNDLPASPSITGVVRFSLVPVPAGDLPAP